MAITNPKTVVLGAQSRSKMLEGINILADAVSATLGPKGRNVVLAEFNQLPAITKDGVSVAKGIAFSDPVMNAGADIVKMISKRACDEAGDGTTTATVLGRAIITNALSAVENGHNPMDVYRGIEYVAAQAETILNEMAMPCDSYESMLNIATISANSDKVIGEMIAKTVESVGTAGVITIEKSQLMEDELTLLEGYEFDRGWKSPYFINDSAKQAAIYRNCAVMIFEGEMNDLNTAQWIATWNYDNKVPVLVIAEDYSAEVTNAFVALATRNKQQIVIVRSPGYGNRKTGMLEDMATLVGGQVVNLNAGDKVEEQPDSFIGYVDKMQATRTHTTLIGARGDKDAIEARMKHVEGEINAATHAFDEQHARDRLAMLNGSVGVIRVGGVSEIDMSERKDRYDDAVCATRAAVADGILPGGGVGLIRAAAEIQKTLTEKLTNADQIAGASAALQAMSYPLTQIAKNAGANEEEVVSTVSNHSDDLFYGYNAANGTYGNMLDMGVIDPARVTKSAIKYAATIAGLLVTTECIVVDEQRETRMGAIR